ncbi:PLDc N-terminal domain-containing protein [Lysinibacillus sp. SGAir0095]|uniref:PLDc N-terminal domain-containing protein n=1 Tax=Lysinibacillus sp. SGAir0095 TaxID=2070463 RepID=UPI0010CD0C6C|nr:PLDc N-terminal domain-containing protein [Lysinibacillus sp. SGAir0095]QCR33768.1 transcriptional regulator [Lysinibacillus sp. SGAir0095]
MRELLNEVPWGVIAPILGIQLLLVIIALVFCIRSEKTNGPKWMWILIILFINIIGPVLYFVIGRRND